MEGKETHMIKVYGMPSCPGCQKVIPQIAGKEGYEFIDIGSHVKLLKEFLAIRDHNPALAEAKAQGRAGIPCFVLEDGTVTLDVEAAGLLKEPAQGCCSGGNC